MINNSPPHPGLLLSELLEEKGISQRDLASRLQIAHSQLNNILNGNRAININIALSLEAAGYKTASHWLTKQMEYELSEAQKDEEISQKNKTISVLKDIEEIVPISYLKKIGLLKGDTEENINEVYKIYKVDNNEALQKYVNTYNFSKFRKSSKFLENKTNVIAWSAVAEYIAKQEIVDFFDKSKESILIEELKKCFYLNKNTLNDTKIILKKYGIKFFTLDRPSQTPVDGKSFICGSNPVIVLSLKYKRLDNFAFTLMHELGHVFKHLTTNKYKNEEFFIGTPNIEIEEFEADTYAKNNLIDPEIWKEFLLSNDEFHDDTILELAKNIKTHPSIIRGRICFEYPEYYRKRSSINNLNVLT